MKIAMLGQKRIPSREGGVEIVVEQLSTRMARAGHDVTCYNRGGHHVSGSEYDGVNLKEYEGVRLKKAFTIDKKGLAAMTSSFFAALKIAFSHYDIVHFHAEGPCAMIWLPKLFGKKVIATIHGLDWQRAKWGGFATKYIKFGEKTAVKHADEIIVLSENVKQYFLDEYNRETVMIPNGVCSAENIGVDVIGRKYSLKKDEYFLFLGRLVPEKGVEYLINAFMTTDMDKKLVIAGGSSDTSNYEKHLKDIAKNDSRIIFTGFVQGKELSELYSNAYVYVLPSDLEGMPLSLMEAMSYSNCCLTSDIPECTQVTGEYGVSFERGNEKDLANKLKMLYNGKDTVREYKSKAAEYICRKFSWDDVTKETLEQYESALNKSRK